MLKFRAGPFGFFGPPHPGSSSSSVSASQNTNLDTSVEYPDKSKLTSGCSFPASGNVFYQDSYGIIYKISWTTVGQSIDITTITYDPLISGRQTASKRVGNIIYANGTITTTRQIIKLLDNGYEIVADASDVTTGYFQYNFPGNPRPYDNFCYHNNNQVQDDLSIAVTQGTRWCQVDGTTDDLATTWPYLDGSEVGGVFWDDVWSNISEVRGSFSYEFSYEFGF